MNALLWKDLVSTKVALVVMLAFAILFPLGFGKGGMMGFFIGPAIATTMVGTSLNLDDKSGWCRYAISSGIDRKTIVMSKLILGMIAAFLGVLSGFASLGLAHVINGMCLQPMDILKMCILGFAFGIFTSCVMIYSCYRFDPSYCGLFAATIIGASAGFMTGADDLVGRALADMNWIFPLMAMIFIALAAVLFLFAQKVMAGKDY